MKYFHQVDTKKTVDEREREILDFWEKEKIFQKSLLLRKDASRYSFFDGPPFATGTPHYGHLVGSVMKDVLPRYWTMRGKYVERRWGWDCHGLPIENIVEKEMGSKSKKDIEDLGIENFNRQCRENVLGYVDEWRKTITRFGRWADMDNAYRTMDPEYMESVWWVFGELWKKGLIYEGYRSMHICPRCETTLSQSEVAEGYKDIKDISVVSKFELVDEPKTFVLAWTTTPWTLLGNIALAVGKNITYSVVRIEGEEEKYIVAQERIENIFGEKKYTKERSLQGVDLIGKAYKPLFTFAKENENVENSANGWKIYGADFVTTEEGSGIVHIAPAYGSDDMALGKEYKLPFVQHVGIDGMIKSGYGIFSGKDIRPRVKNKLEEIREIDIEILKGLKENNGYFSHKKYEHSYPHCWRCDTALLNYATSSWFVSVEKMKEKALVIAKDIHWIPDHIKEGRFGNWLSGARDWSISRQRFWASVLPIWRCESCKNVRAISSVMEIERELGGVSRLYLIRHGEAQNNVGHFLDSKVSSASELTEKGKEQIEEASEELKNKKIEYIFYSPLLRTKISAQLLHKKFGGEMIEDERLREVGCGSLEGQSVDALRERFPSIVDQEGENLPQGVEKYENVEKRVADFLESIQEKYTGKNIAIVSHADILILIDAKIKDASKEEIKKRTMFRNGEIRSVFSKKIDLHRPYIDEVKLSCECGGVMHRIPDVLDTWFDSGSMPYAQIHYPFENEEKFKKSFPADFIGEGVDQTRAWFYYLHILATALKEKNAFSHVIVNGIVQAQDGKKMSKKLKNYPDPATVLEKYGADVLRLYLLGSPVVMAENINFSEKEMGELSRGIFRMLRNTYSFFIMYADIDGWKPSMEKNEKREEEKNILDRWILSEFHKTARDIHEAMEAYELSKAVRYFSPFVDDLSNWYIRRSRKRFWKSENDGDKNEAYETLYYVLKELSKLLAPFAPFIAEEMYRNLMGSFSSGEGKEKGEVSVHLTEYPQGEMREDEEDEMGEQMKRARTIVNLGLQIRAKKGIKVRQPLSILYVCDQRVYKEYADMIVEELNVKELRVVSKESQCEEQENIVWSEANDLRVGLSLKISSTLLLEGQAREIVRIIQEMRKKAGYNIDDRICLGYVGKENVFEVFGVEVIAYETLCKSVSNEILEKYDILEEVFIDGEKMKISLYK
ncbi:MAG: hypothetical protein EOM19_02755 [Candidatus Moranbacteria bacterium]|nr:hypothetical protein [Candidatus Moranbacteria bacterium]